IFGMSWTTRPIPRPYSRAFPPWGTSLWGPGWACATISTSLCSVWIWASRPTTLRKRDPIVGSTSTTSGILSLISGSIIPSRVNYLLLLFLILTPNPQKIMSHNIKPGVATGDQVQAIFKHAKEKGYALPAVNVVGSDTINAVMESAAALNAPVIIQFSNGGAQFNAGKGLSNENQQAAILGAVAGAKHIHQLAEAYGATVILHTDHCAKKLLPWIDGLLDASEQYFKETGKPLY